MSRISPSQFEVGLLRGLGPVSQAILVQIKENNK